jgi:hypothetical protein
MGSLQLIETKVPARVGKQKGQPIGCPVMSKKRVELDFVNDVGEHVTDCRAENREDCDNDDCYQHQDQCVLYEALAFFTGLVHHEIKAPKIDIM